MPVSSTLLERFQAASNTFENMDRLLATPDERLKRRVETISGWTPAQHLCHLALANTHMLSAVDRIAHQTAPAAAGGGLTMVGRFVLLTGHIPRGKGKAPAISVPPTDPGRLEAAEMLRKSRLALLRVKGELPRVEEATWRVDHYVFGRLDAQQWLKLVKIHADHHFKIIDEILAAG